MLFKHRIGLLGFAHGCLLRFYSFLMGAVRGDQAINGRGVLRGQAGAAAQFGSDADARLSARVACRSIRDKFNIFRQDRRTGQAVMFMAFRADVR